MDSRTTIYIDKDCLEEIAFLSIEKALPNLFTLFKRYCDICTNIEASFYDEYIENPVSQLFNGHDIPRPYDLSAFFDELNIDETLYGEKANDIFVLNKNKSDIQKIREKYAVWIFGIDEIEDKMFRCLNHQATYSEQQEKTWKNIFEDAHQTHILPPSSCALITDHYLIKNEFKDKTGLKLVGLWNIEQILQIIIPQKSNQYTIVMFFKNEGINNKEALLRKWINQIKQDFTCKNLNIIAVNVPLEIEHDRYFYTNYFWIEAGTGFSLLKKEIDYTRGKSVVREKNKITIKTYTTEDEDRTGDSNKETSSNNISNLKKIFDNALNNIENSPTLPRIISDMSIEQIKELEINLF